MSDKKSENELLDHNYDGIQEFDNPLPNWWLATFYGAILFSVCYVAYYHFGPGPSLDDELAFDLAQVRALKEVNKSIAPITEEDLKAVFIDVEKKELGRKVFTEKCAACHGVQGEGQIGPNLTDAYWLHGNGSLLALLKTISEGVPEKGMPPWSTMLKPAEITAVTAFTKSLQGTYPANPKAQQGELIKN